MTQSFFGNPQRKLLAEIFEMSSEIGTLEALLVEAVAVLRDFPTVANKSTELWYINQAKPLLDRLQDR